jgi:RNA polymerase sigma-70 factor, ECF subfamily
VQFTAFDALYLERLRSGDRRTEQHFAGYFSELIRLKLRSRLNSKEAIEDARQETFVRVLALIRAPDGVRQPERLGALVNSVCNHVLMEAYRAKTRRESSIDDEDESVFVAEPAPGVLEARDAERAVTEILGEMPERDRRLLKFVFLEERDKDDVCVEMGVTREYLRVLLHRAKESFKSLSKGRASDV